MNIYTIGFSGKSAEEFFTLLTKNKVRKLIDIRLNNKSQLAGFANAKHLSYFLKIHNIEYEYRQELAPSKELLDGYKNENINWEQYINIYIKILNERKILDKIKLDDFEDSVLLCSEPTSEQCHRRLLAEYLSTHFDNINIKHL